MYVTCLVSIPSRLRRELGLGKGSKLLWEKLGEHEIRVVILPEVKARGARAMLGFARRFRPTRPTQEWMGELQDGETEGSKRVEHRSAG